MQDWIYKLLPEKPNGGGTQDASVSLLEAAAEVRYIATLGLGEALDRSQFLYLKLWRSWDLAKKYET